jgi:hypothetical protein
MNMNPDQSQALRDLTRNVWQLTELFEGNTIDRKKINDAYQLILETRCNANLVKSYVTERISEETVMA